MEQELSSKKVPSLDELDSFIIETIEEYINPSLNQHTGSVELEGISFYYPDKNSVGITIGYNGLCSSCTSSRNSTLDFIALFLKLETLEKFNVEYDYLIDVINDDTNLKEYEELISETDRAE